MVEISGYFSPDQNRGGTKNLFINILKSMDYLYTEMCYKFFYFFIFQYVKASIVTTHISPNAMSDNMLLISLQIKHKMRFPFKCPPLTQSYLFFYFL